MGLGVTSRVYIGFRDISPITEHQMDKNMEDDMGSGFFE